MVRDLPVYYVYAVPKLNIMPAAILLDSEVLGGPGSLYDGRREVSFISQPEISIEYRVSYWKKANARELEQLEDLY